VKNSITSASDADQMLLSWGDQEDEVAAPSLALAKGADESQDVRIHRLERVARQLRPQLLLQQLDITPKKGELYTPISTESANCCFFLGNMAEVKIESGFEPHHD